MSQSINHLRFGEIANEQYGPEYTSKLLSNARAEFENPDITNEINLIANHIDTLPEGTRNYVLSQIEKMLKANKLVIDTATVSAITAVLANRGLASNDNSYRMVG